MWFRGEKNKHGFWFNGSGTLLSGVVGYVSPYTAGTNITIGSGNVISATDTTYTAGTGISIENNVISATGGSGGGMDEEAVKELIGNEYGMSKVAGAEPVRSISGTLGDALNISASDLGVWTSS